MNGAHKKRKAQKPSTDSQSSIFSDRKWIISKSSSFHVREAYNSLRTNVSYALADTEHCKVMLVTSAMPSEGKSITSLNLAITMSETGKRVLLIDADMRLPKLGGLLELSSEAGLSELLIGAAVPEKAMLNYSDCMDVILAGHIPPNPSELLGSARMNALIEKLREQYDYILLDAPPVDVVTDACVASKWTDGVLIVVRANYSERGAVSRAVGQMKYANAVILGFVLNGTGSGSAYYSKHRYNKYGYSKHGKYSRYSRYEYRNPDGEETDE